MDFDQIFPQNVPDWADEPPDRADDPPRGDAPGEDKEDVLLSDESDESDFFSQHLLRREHRRGFLKGAAAGVVFSGAAALGGYAIWKATRPSLVTPATAGIPGKYPGNVVEVHHPGSVKSLRRDRGVVKAMIHRGLVDLVGCVEPVDAWRSFFQPGDRVGIKVVPVGKPDSISSPEVVLEVIDGLLSAGVRRRDILVFERYKEDFLACNYHSVVPDGVHWECSSVAYDDLQTALDGQLSNRPRQARIAGYDPDVFVELPYCQPGHDQKDDARFRSHLSTIISQKVDKFISIPVLKDHRSAGVTLSLKNLSHGSVSNVARSHIGHGYQTHDGRTLNQCGTFIPAVVALPQIREKAVLQILDGLVGTYEGGPGNWNSTFATWEYKSLFFATDPVALDHVGWRIIDEKRAAQGLPRVAEMGIDAHAGLAEFRPAKATEQFHIRQPQHIPLAGLAGLGVFDWKEINHRRIELGS